MKLRQSSPSLLYRVSASVPLASGVRSMPKRSANLVLRRSSRWNRPRTWSPPGRTSWPLRLDSDQGCQASCPAWYEHVGSIRGNCQWILGPLYRQSLVHRMHRCLSHLLLHHHLLPPRQLRCCLLCRHRRRCYLLRHSRQRRCLHHRRRLRHCCCSDGAEVADPFACQRSVLVVVVCRRGKVPHSQHLMFWIHCQMSMWRPLRILDRCRLCHIRNSVFVCVNFGDHIMINYTMYYATYSIFYSLLPARGNLTTSLTSLVGVRSRTRHKSPKTVALDRGTSLAQTCFFSLPAHLTQLAHLKHLSLKKVRLDFKLEWV